MRATGESLGPDLEHDEPIGPHYDLGYEGLAVIVSIFDDESYLVWGSL